MSNLSFLQIRTPKDDETPISATTQIFSSLLPYPYIPGWKRLFGAPKIYGFEIYLLGQTIYMYIVTPAENEALVRSLVSSSYPKSMIKKTTDPMDLIFKSKSIALGEMVLNNAFYYPIKTYAEFTDVDPLGSILGFMARQDPNLRMAIQMLITPASFHWQSKGFAATKSAPAAEGETAKAPEAANKQLVSKKASFQGGKVGIRLLVGSQMPGLPVQPFLQNLAGIFGTFSMAEGNTFGFKKPLFGRDKLVKKIKNRDMDYLERRQQIMNAQEMATLWHPPGMALAGLRNISWGKTLAGEAPANLPVSDGLSEEEKLDINFFAKTEFKNKDTIFGIKSADRRKHVYIIGKTGAGKSTLIANMAVDDIRKDRGIGVIDPHGDLCETILEYIPKRRINDVVYLEPFDAERPFSLNVLEVKNKQQKELVASGIISIFHKIYIDSWGPRLEYILRMVIMTLLNVPDTTLVDILTVLTNDSYRKKVVDQLQDPVLKGFWEKEFAKMPDRMKSEAVSPIQNKVGQFVTSVMIRNILGTPKSTINLEEIMNEKKILILNLSQGKLGEDNAALLGAMFITQIQLAAMNRSFMKEEDRKDFFLYVDEFQNFATSSFVKILSEARKYRLALTLANQYIDQLEENIRGAIFGNVGTLMSFVTGATDAEILTREYAGIYSQNDLVSLGKHEAVLKLCIDNMTSMPFPAKTLPLPSLKNDNVDKIVKLSKEKYGRKPDSFLINVNPETTKAPAPAPQQPKKEPKPQNVNQQAAPKQPAQNLPKPQGQPNAPKQPNVNQPKNLAPQPQTEGRRQKEEVNQKVDGRSQTLESKPAQSMPKSRPEKQTAPAPQQPKVQTPHPKQETNILMANKPQLDVLHTDHTQSSSPQPRLHNPQPHHEQRPKQEHTGQPMHSPKQPAPQPHQGGQTRPQGTHPLKQTITLSKPPASGNPAHHHQHATKAPVMQPINTEIATPLPPHLAPQKTPKLPKVQPLPGQHHLSGKK